MLKTKYGYHVCFFEGLNAERWFLRIILDYFKILNENIYN